MKFTTQLTPPKTRFGGGGGHINVNRLADEVFGSELSGPWLVCYMLRRFGWPNVGSDPYKDLCTWCLTTPIEGLYLVVRPHLTDGGRKPPEYPYSANIHFSVASTKEVGAQLLHNPEAERHWQRVEKAFRRWWEREGESLYAIGWSTEETDVLVEQWARRDDGTLYGLWKRPDDYKPRRLPKKPLDFMLLWALSEFLKKAHPGVIVESKRTRPRRDTAFQRRAASALKATLRDLKRPTYVRDLGFSPSGRDDRYTKAIAEPWEGAGNAPSYWFSARRKRDERRERVEP